MIRVNKDIAKHAANNCIQSIKDHRTNLLLKEVSKVKQSTWSKLFRKNWTEEQFTDLVILNGDFSDPWNCIYGNLLIECKEILAMCELSVDSYISVDGETSRMILKWSSIGV